MAGHGHSPHLHHHHHQHNHNHIRCSFKRATMLVFASNLLLLLFYILQSWLQHQHSQPSAHLATHLLTRRPDGTVLPVVLGRTQAQLKSVRESNSARLALEPVKLIQRVKEIEQEVVPERGAVRASTKGQQKAEEISKRFTGQHFQGLDQWRGEKLKHAKTREEAAAKPEVNSQEREDAALVEEVVLLLSENPFEQEEGSGFLPGGAEVAERMSRRVRKSERFAFPESMASEAKIFTKELTLLLDHMQKSPINTYLRVKLKTEDGIIPGRSVPEACHAEAHTDYDGFAVRWGLTHHVESAADCCEECLNHAKNAKGDEKKCNVWVYCPVEVGCFSPDIYEHKHQECWLKQADDPKINFKGHYDEEYRQQHPTAPRVVPWVSGVIAN